jgi:DNA-directed RNA polymerase specialized sigma24 family protein
MHWLRNRETQENQNTGLVSRPEAQVAFAEQKENLYWTALMITGDVKLAGQSIVDATSVTETNNYAFRAWLVQWAHLATARVALNAVRSSIHETAAYADSTCSHRKHKPLSPTEIRSLHELDAHAVIQQLDILARTVLVLYGCQHASLSDCVLLLNVPLRCVLSAYCRALQCHRQFMERVDKTQAAFAGPLFTSSASSFGGTPFTRVLSCADHTN